MKLTELCSEPLPGGLDLSEEVLIGKDLCGEMPRLVAEHTGPKPLWLADSNTWDALRKADLDHKSGRPAGEEALLLLPGKPHADSEQVGRVCGRVEGEGFSGIVAIGSGTVNDIAKMSATLSGVPYIAFATAASMNGYTSGIAAILADGLKITVPARPPRSHIMYSNGLANAPP